VITEMRPGFDPTGCRTPVCWLREEFIVPREFRLDGLADDVK
jgi:hypothetical protein